MAINECIHGVNFGCSGNRTLWVSHGCRGDFTCDGQSDVSCGAKSQIGQAVWYSRVPFHCSCAANKAVQQVEGQRLIGEWEQAAYGPPPTGAAPLPLPNAQHVHTAWEESHVRSLLALAERVRLASTQPGSGRDDARALLRAPPVTLRLSQCGQLMVPFGGAYLHEMESHLRGFVVASAGQAVERSSTASSSSAARRPPAASGFIHVVESYVPSEPDSLRRLGLPSDLVLRQKKTNDSMWRAEGNEEARCFAYRTAVWNAYVQWMLGELDVFSRTHVLWICWETVTVASLIERASDVSELFEAPPSAEGFMASLVTAAEPLAESLVGQIVALSNGSDVINLDIKPRDMLVRRAGTLRGETRPEGEVKREVHKLQAWEARLSDLVVQGRWRSTAGLIPGLLHNCYLLLNLLVPTVVFACGPLRGTAVAQHFVPKALAALGRAHPRSYAVRHCLRKPNVNQSADSSALIRDDEGLRTGQLSVSRAAHMCAHCALNAPSEDARPPRCSGAPVHAQRVHCYHATFHLYTVFPFTLVCRYEHSGFISHGSTLAAFAALFEQAAGGNLNPRCPRQFQIGTNNAWLQPRSG